MPSSPASIAQPHPVSQAWQIDQSTLTQGMSKPAIARMKTLQGQASAIWQKTAALAVQQPIVESCDDATVQAIKAAVASLESVADQLVVIGTGGASLGAQTLCAFAPHPGRVVFLENCDAHSANALFNGCNLVRTAWVIISKSGETVETLAASLALIAHYKAKAAPLAGRVYVITSAGDRPLRALANHQHWPVLDHPSNLGGRFSVFSCVGLLPAAFAGISVEALLAAARDSWAQGLEARDSRLYDAACWFTASLAEQPLHVVMGYSDRLRPYTQWYKQLWAESLGKNGAGPTPVTAVGAIDQHSQLQLYLDGTNNKLFTLILPDGPGPAVPLARVDIPHISYLSNHTMQDIMHASAEATSATLKSKNLPLRVLKAELTVEHLSQLMVRTILETLLVAAMLGIDPYSQPAVEEGKARARKSLGYQG